jgi:hypothetical protein
MLPAWSVVGASAAGHSERPIPVALVLDALCEAFQADAHADLDDVSVVVGATRPVFERLGLRLALDPDTEVDGATALADLEADGRLIEDFVAEPIDVATTPPDDSCVWVQGTQRASDYDHVRALVVEISPRLRLELGDSVADGVFVRVSLGLRSGATWYFVALGEGHGQSRPRALALDVSDG